MNKLQVRVDQVPGQINFNYEEIKENLSQMMDLYKDATFTEESKATARKEVAALRKMKTAIDDTRKDVKRKCLEPYQDFESKAVALMSLIDEPILLIDKQVKAFDKKQKAEKREKIHEAYESMIGDIAEYLPFERALDTKWLNSSASIKKAKDELQAFINSVQVAVQTISAMQSDATQEALAMYKRTLDMAASIQYINEYERRKAEILLREQQRQREEEDRRHQAELERIREEERRRVAEEERIREEECRKLQTEAAKEAVKEAAESFFDPEDVPVEGFWTDDDPEAPFDVEKRITAFYKVSATETELEEIEMAFNSIGILFERRDA